MYQSLYEIGYIKPELIAEYVNDFIKLLSSRNNRLVWGCMIALSTIAQIKYEEILELQNTFKNAIEKRPVITVDGGLKTLSKIAACGGDPHSTGTLWHTRGSAS